MDEDIADTLHEDTDFVLRLAAAGRLLPGRIDSPTSMRRVHAENRVSAPRTEAIIYRDKMRLRAATYRWCRREGLKEQRQLVFMRMLDVCVREKPDIPGDKPAPVRKLTRLVTWAVDYPLALLEGYYWLELARSVWGVARLPFRRKK